jgi:hypothetical protein
MPPSTEVQREVEIAIKPWKSSNEKPPYSDVELATIAWVLGGSMDKRAVITWIKNAFPYYAKLDLDAQDSDFIWDALGMFELPATGPEDDELPTSWDVLIPETRSYLQPMLGRKRQGAFTFLQLPSELRNKIYEMVFQYPRFGLSPRYQIDAVKREGRIEDFMVMARDYSTPFSFRLWAPRCCHLLQHTQSTGQILGLLRVNKQISEEAFTHFYLLNLFYFFNVRDLDGFLRGMPVYRRQHLSQLAFRYRPGDSEEAISAFRYLASMPNLRKLYIYISEPSWTYAHTLGRFDPLKIPGLQILRSIRGLDEVVFGEDCPTIAAYLKPEME